MTDLFDDFEDDELNNEENEVEVDETQEAEISETEEAEEAPAQEPVRTEVATQSETMVPLAAIMEEREKAKVAKARAEQLEAQLAEYQKRQSDSEIPDPVLDPERYNQFMFAQQQQFAQQAIIDDRFERSAQSATQKYGAEKIAELRVWAGEMEAKDPNWAALALSQSDPVEWALSQREQQSKIDAYLNDPEAFILAEIEKRGLVAAQAATQTTTQTTTASNKPAPKSISGAKSRSTTDGESDDYGSLFD